MNQIRAYGAVGSTENNRPPSAPQAGTAIATEINTPGDGRKATNVERRVGGTGGTGTHSSGLIAAISGGSFWELLNFANEASRSPIRVMERHETPRVDRCGLAPEPAVS